MRKFVIASLLSAFGFAAQASAHPLVLAGDQCQYETSVSEETGDLRVLVSGEGFAVSFSLDAGLLPLVSGDRIDVSESTGNPNDEASLIFDGAKVKFRQQGHTDFLETTWMTLTVDADLASPTKIVIRQGLSGIPLSWTTCHLGE